MPMFARSFSPNKKHPLVGVLLEMGECLLCWGSAVPELGWDFSLDATVLIVIGFVVFLPLNFV